MNKTELYQMAEAEGLKVRVTRKGLPVPTPPRHVIEDLNEEGDILCYYIVEAEKVAKQKEAREARKRLFHVEVKAFLKKGPVKEVDLRVKAASPAAAAWQAIKEAKVYLKRQHVASWQVVIIPA